MTSFMVLVYGPEFDLLRIFNFFVCKCYLKKSAYESASLSVLDACQLTLIAHHPPKSTNRTRENANKL